MKAGGKLYFSMRRYANRQALLPLIFLPCPLPPAPFKMQAGQIGVEKGKNP